MKADVLEIRETPSVMHILGFIAKPKLILAAISNMTIVAIASCWLLAGGIIFKAVEVVAQNNEPTLPEVNQHVLYDDKRIDALHDDISDRLKRLEDNRDDRRRQSDERYKDLADRLRSIEHDDAYLWGGGAIGTSIVTILLTLNIIKVNKTEQRMREYPIRFHRTSDNDLEQNELLAKFLESMVDKERERIRKEKG